MSEEIATSKGTILRSLLKFLERELTPEQYESVQALLPEEDAEILSVKVLPSQRVPEATLNRLTEAGARVKGEDLDRFGIRAGRAELEDSIGIYRFLLVVLTPAGLLSKASAFWGSVHNKGKLTVVESADLHAIVTLEDFPSERAHCARLTGWFYGLAERTKVHNLRIEHQRCKARGQEICEWRIDWDR